MAALSPEDLRTIRAFTEDQLLSLHSIHQIDRQDDVVTCFLQVGSHVHSPLPERYPPDTDATYTHSQDCIQAQETEFYQQLSKLKRWKFLLESKTRIYCTEKVSQGKIFENQYWSLNNRQSKGKSRCNDGRVIEVKHNYQEAVPDPDVMTNIRQCYDSLKDQIAVNYAAHFFASQYNEKQVEILIKSAILSHSSSSTCTPAAARPGSPTNGIRRPPGNNSLDQYKQLKNLITCLFAFIRSEQDMKSEHFHTLREWLSQLVEILLKHGDCHEDHMFLLHHVLRCCGGISNWAIGFIQCSSPLEADTVDDAVTSMNNCLLMISTILSPVR